MSDFTVEIQTPKGVEPYAVLRCGGPALATFTEETLEEHVKRCVSALGEMRDAKRAQRAKLEQEAAQASGKLARGDRVKIVGGPGATLNREAVVVEITVGRVTVSEVDGLSQRERFQLLPHQVEKL